MVVAWWHFRHSFLPLIPRNIFGYISKFKIFFEKLDLYRVRHLELSCDEYSSIVPTFSCLWSATAQWNFLHSFFSLIPRYIFGSFRNSNFFFKKLNSSWKNFRRRYNFIAYSIWYTVSSYQCLAMYWNLFRNSKYFSKNIQFFVLRLI